MLITEEIFAVFESYSESLATIAESLSAISESLVRISENFDQLEASLVSIDANLSHGIVYSANGFEDLKAGVAELITKTNSGTETTLLRDRSGKIVRSISKPVTE